MKIGIDASRACVADWGGQDNYAYYLIKALEKIDLINNYTLFSHAKPVRRLTKADNFTLKVMKFPRLWTQLRLALETFVMDVDVLFIPVHTIPYFHKPNLKTVVTVHDLSFELMPEYFRFPGRLYLRQYMRYSCQHATHLIAVSEATKHSLRDIYGIEEKRISVVPEGYDQTLFKVLNEKETEKVVTKYKLKEPYILNVGTIQPRKNIVRLIEAFSIMRKTTELPHTLVIVGKPGWKNEDIYTAPARYGVTDAVRFLGHVPDNDLPSLFNRAEIFIYPSLYEGFGLPVIEAMACGTPVITSNVSSLPEAAGDAGVLVDPNNIEEMTSALINLAINPDKRQSMVGRGLKWSRNFMWESAARRTLAVLEGVGHE